MRFFHKITICLAAILFVAGCAAEISTDVSRFPSTKLPDEFSGKTFAFMPKDSQKGSTEYETHAALITSYLEKFGWLRTSNSSDADYAVIFSYGQSAPQRQTTQTPIYGQISGGTTNTSGTLNTYNPSGDFGFSNFNATSYTPPKYGVIGTSSSTTITYTRFIEAQIYDWKKSVSEGNLIGVWEAKATSTGSDSSFAAVSKCMVKAVFSEFLKTGTERVQLTIDQCE